MTLADITHSESDAWRGALVVPPGRLRLSRALAYEVRRLRAGRGALLLVAASVSISVLLGLAAGADPEQRNAGGGYTTAYLVDALQMSATTLQVPLVGVLLFCLGSGAVTNEYRHRVARTTFLTVSSRWMAYAAKVIVPAVVTAATVLLAMVAGAVTMAVTNDGLFNDATAASRVNVWGALAGYVFVTACWPVIAVGVAAIVRSRVAVVLFMVVWPLFGERLFGLFLSSVLHLDRASGYLPFAVSRAAMLFDPAGPEEPVNFSGSSTSPGPALLLFTAFVAVIALAGGYFYDRRDAP